MNRQRSSLHSCLLAASVLGIMPGGIGGSPFQGTPLPPKERPEVDLAAIKSRRDHEERSRKGARAKFRKGKRR